MKFLISRTFEGWRALNREPLGPTFREYKEEFQPEVLESLKVLGRSFGKNNLLGTLRNKVGFHLDIPALKEGYDAIGADEELVDYISDAVGNGLNYAAELSSVMAMVKLTDLDLAEALELIIDQATDVSGHLNDVLQAIIFIFVTRYLGVTAENVRADPTELQAPALMEVFVPFFTEQPTKEEAENLPDG